MQPPVPTDEGVVPELPGEDLRWRVAGHPDPSWFWKSGATSIANIRTMLSIVGKTFADYPRALEFGCGCGRMLLHAKQIAEKTELHAVDIDAQAVDWVQGHIPWVEASVNKGRPPLAFPDEHFDLVFNQSVFTHLDESYQDAWLAELVRVTKPGGALVLSVSGDHPFSEFVKALRDNGADPTKHIERFRAKGILFIEDDSYVGGPFPDFYHSTFHAPWYVFEHWSRFFEVKAYVPRGSLDFQDYVLLRRREGPSPIREADPWQAFEARVAALAPKRLAKKLYRRLKEARRS